jgi:hypothetical protein
MAGFPKNACKYAFVSVVCGLIYFAHAIAQDGQTPSRSRQSGANQQHSAPLAKDGLYICAEHTDPYDWEVEFSKGPIVIPVGTVFDCAGHIMGGNLQDPKDTAHFDHSKAKKGNSPLWTGISPAELERREALISQDFAIDTKNTSAVATTKQVTLTKPAPAL